MTDSLLSIWSLGYYPLPEFLFSVFTQLGTQYPSVLNSFHFLREPSLTNWKEHSSPHFPIQYFNFYLFAYCYTICPARMEAPKGKRLFSSHFPLPNKVHYMKRHIFIFHLKCDLFWWLLCGCWAVYLDTMIFLRWVLICTYMFINICSYIYDSFTCLLKKPVYRFPCRLSIVIISCNNIRDYLDVVPI